MPSEGVPMAEPFPSPRAFELLLKARDGVFDPHIPTRLSASPIDANLSSRSFYVFVTEADKLAGIASQVTRGKMGPNEICVKYNNCSRSRVWWSEEHNNCLGMVARRMGMKARHSSGSAGGADDKGVDRHGYEGHWLTLVERESPGPITDKTVLRKYILDKAPSLVQYWPAKGQKQLEAQKLLEQPQKQMCIPPQFPLTQVDRAGVRAPIAALSPSSPYSTYTDTSNNTEVMEEERKESVSSSGQGSSARGSVSNSGDELEIPLGDEPYLPGTAAAAVEAAKVVQQQRRKRRESCQKVVYSENPEDSGFYAAKRLRAGYEPSLTSEDEEEQLNILCELLEETNEQAAEVRVQQQMPPAMDSTFAAYEIFRSVCDTFTPDEFRRWYSMFARTLFLPNVARGLQYFLERNDPRLRPDFMFTKHCCFLPNLPIATLEYTGSYALGFKLTKVDATTFSLMELDDDFQQQDNVYENLLESKMALLCQHLYFKQMVGKGELDLELFWFHNVIKAPKSGRRLVVRGFSRVDENFGDLHNEKRTIQMQDVSDMYHEILDLPALPC